jgi:hypothetical protein
VTGDAVEDCGQTLRLVNFVLDRRVDHHFQLQTDTE